MHMEMIEHKKQRTAELKKHVAVIHSNSSISLLQRKISNALLYNAYDSLLTKDEHEIQISDLTKLIGYDSHDHKKIKQSLIDLLSTVIEWNIVDGEKIDKDNIWNASSIIADASICGSKCTYSYSNKMRQLLYHPSVYGRLNMHVQAKFQSSYGLALYENCNRYQDIGQTPWFDIHQFRRLMGVGEDKYKVFRDFKIRVLNKSVEEVNLYSSLNIEPKLRKQNRQVTAIQFIIKLSEHRSPIPLEESQNESSLEDSLKLQFGLSQRQMMDVMSQYDSDYIQEKISIIVRSPSYESGKIKNIGKYLLCALHDDYQSPKPLLRKEQKSPYSTNNEHIDRYQQYIRQTIESEIRDDTDPNHKIILEQFKQYIDKTVFSKFYEKEGLSNILVQDQWIKFILGSKNYISKQLKTYEQWLSE